MGVLSYRTIAYLNEGSVYIAALRLRCRRIASLVAQMITLWPHNRVVPSSIPAQVEKFFWVWVEYS